jgi:hypothetical protein
MFEKSKSAITFEEFKKKINEVNNFENDWGHFYDPDNDSNVNNNNNIFKHNLYKPKKVEIKKVEIKKVEAKKIETNKIETNKIEVKRENEDFIDIEKLEKIKKLHDEEDDETNVVVEIVFNCVKKIFITFTMVYFIFKII